MQIDVTNYHDYNHSFAWWKQYVNKNDRNFNNMLKIGDINLQITLLICCRFQCVVPTYNVLKDECAWVGMQHSATARQRCLKDEMGRVFTSVTIFWPQTQVTFGDTIPLRGHRTGSHDLIHTHLSRQTLIQDDCYVGTAARWQFKWHLEVSICRLMRHKMVRWYGARYPVSGPKALHTHNRPCSLHHHIYCVKTIRSHILLLSILNTHLYGLVNWSNSYLIYWRT